MSLTARSEANQPIQPIQKFRNILTAAAMLDRYAVFGFPVAHSQSPFIHQAFAQQTGQALVYDRRECSPDAFAANLREWVSDDSGGPVRGCNVTMPFKFEALSLAQQCSERASLAGAANVLRFDAQGWSADNTDGAGLVRDLVRNQHLELRGRRLLVLGAGGAAAGILGPLLGERPQSLLLCNRTHAKADMLVQRHAAAARKAGADLQAAPLDALDHLSRQPDGSNGFDVVINASATSMTGAAPPAPARVLGEGCFAVDLVYGAAAEPFLQWALSHGAGRAIDGLGMLVEQAALAFEWWRGVQPQTAPVLQALRARLAAGTRA